MSDPVPTPEVSEAMVEAAEQEWCACMGIVSLDKSMTPSHAADIRQRLRLVLRAALRASGPVAPPAEPEDSARLDWLEEHVPELSKGEEDSEAPTVWHVSLDRVYDGGDLREAIDAARSSAPLSRPAPTSEQEEK